MSVVRRYVTIVATDCVSFSSHMLDNEEKTLSSLNSCRDIIDSFISKHGGRIFHTAGDSVLAEFSSSVEAVNCAINFQDAIHERNQNIGDDSDDRKLIWRVGIHCDDVIVEKDNIYGNGVNIAARLESQCLPGQILVSRIINENVKSQIDAISHAAGTKQLKNISSDFEVFTIGTSHTDYAEVTEKPDHTDDHSAKSKKPILCVLPFKNMNKNEDSSFLVDGIFEDILTELSMVRQLSVVSRQSSINFVENNENLERFIDQFNINFLTEGTARTLGNKVRITISLIETETGEIKWSQKFDRNLDDIFDVQDEIVRNVVHMVLGEIELVSLQRAKRKPTDNMSSYEYLLKGKELHHQFDVDANAEGLRMFDLAIEADPNNAQAYAWKACTLGQAYARNYISDSFEKLSLVWDELISKAIKIDPNDFECHRLLSAVYSGTKKYNLSLEHGKKAYHMVPNDPRILQQYGEALLKTGNTSEGCDLTLLALEYDPVPQGQINSDKRKSDAVFACFMDDRIDLGLKLAEQISQLSARDILCSTCLAERKTENLDDFPWLMKAIASSKIDSFHDFVNEFKNIDIVIYNTILETLNETISSKITS